MNLTRQFYWILVLTVVLGVGSILPKAFAQEFQKYRSLSFTNLAPGEIESSDVVKDYPVKISFASESGIPYAGVYARIFNASGIAVFKHLCEKPLLFLRLPPGDYHVVAVDRKKITRLKPFSVGKDLASRTRVDLVWPKSVVGY